MTKNNLKNTFSLNKKHKLADEGVIGDELDFTAHEAYRLLRTNIMFSFSGKKSCRIIGMVSSVKGEGKTTTAINLSYVLAENGAKVCLIEGDMRMPQLAKRLDLKSKHGLSEILTGQTSVDDALTEKKFKNVSYSVIVSGTIPPNPSELLSSSATAKTFAELSKKFDYIIIDFPPIDVVSDAIVLNNIMDGVVVVVSEGYVSKKLVNNALRQLSLANIKVIGFVRTFVSSTGFNSYKSKYKSRRGGYYKYGYGYSTDKEENAPAEGAPAETGTAANDNRPAAENTTKTNETAAENK